MNEKEKGGHGSRPVFDEGFREKCCRKEGKGKHYYAPLQKIRNLFLSGNVYTAKQLNVLSKSNDARKCISVLRNTEYMPIKDARRADGCKLYWLEPDSKVKEDK
jgi:hypothetical protein